MIQISKDRILFLFVLCLLLALALAACASDRTEMTTGEPSEARPDGWNETSHGNNADPNYDVVFAKDQVNQITISIAPDDWEAMQADMVSLFGDSGSGGDQPGFPGGGFGGEPGQFRQQGEDGLPQDFEPPEGDFPQPGEDGFPEGIEPPAEGDRPPVQEEFGRGNRPGGGAFGFGDMTPENPMWVEATIEFGGEIWTNVGVRYKGNSSLTSGWRSSELKLPLKLDFDQFEDEYPEIEDQRFYGFKQLSLANGFSDSSFLRDAITSETLQEAGLPAAETAFYEVILDYGEGPVTLGLYTVIEVVDDTVVERYFGDDAGNIYEGEGAAASFAASTAEQIEDSFQKENNQDEADWSDIEDLFDVLHSDERISDPVAWRANLEDLFDVDAFLEWLAISAVIEHWDAYGNMSHNYYLYNDPATGRLTWISWDHNMVMSGGMGSANDRGLGGRGLNRSVTLDKAEVGDNWPLIRYLLDDPVYYEQYLDFLAETVEGSFEAGQMAEKFQELADLIAPYAAADVGEDVFDEAVQQLVEYAYQRADAVEEFLSSTGRGVD